MYNEHFGLSRAPFRITPDTKMFYPGGNRGEILEALVYAISSGEGIVKVVGEVGSGKTMLCRMLEERLGDNVDVVYLANPSLSPEDTLHAIAMEMKLDVSPEANRLQVMHALQERLLEMHADKRQVVVFIEEAQSMPIGTLEEIRLLSNLETNRDKLLQIVLFGQPELDRNLEQPEIRQLKERITHSFYLQPFSAEQLREYVNFRMRAVGYRGPDIFRGGAYRRLSKASEGLTRRINILADKALLAAFAEDTFDVGKRHVNIAIKDSHFMRGRRWGLAEISLLTGLVLIGVAVAYTLVRNYETIADRLSEWLPGARTEQVAARPEEPAPLQPVSAAPAESAPVTAAQGTPSHAAAPTEAHAGAPAGEAGATDAGATSLAAADAGGESAQIQPAGMRTAVPVAAGGSRLVLSEALSALPRSGAESGVAAAAPEASADVSRVPESAQPADASDDRAASAPEEGAARGASGPTGASDASGASGDPGASVAEVDAARGASGSGASDASGGSSGPGASAVEDGPASASAAAHAVLAEASAGDSEETVPPSPRAPEQAAASGGRSLGPLTEARLAATRAWLESADDRHFSIQLLLTDFARRDNLEQFLRERQAAGEVDDYYVFETRIRSSTWFGVLYKEYESFSAAKAALEQLPEEFRYHQPFIRNVRDIATLG